MLLPLVLVISVFSPQQGTALDSLIARVELGDAKARKALSATASKLARSADERRLGIGEARLVARVTLALAAPLARPEISVSDNERMWRGPAVRALLRILELDSSDVWSAERLTSIAPYPTLWLPASHELQHLRVLSRGASLPPALAVTRIGLELECGTVESAQHVLDSLPTSALSGAKRAHLEAEVYFARGDPGAGTAAYFRGATAIKDIADVDTYSRDLEWISDTIEISEWKRLEGAHARRLWLERYWTRRDLLDGQLPGTRLVEQFRRWRIALRDYRWNQDGSVAIGVPFPDDYASHLRNAPRINISNSRNPRSRILDDRGGMLLRHGEPDVQVNLPGLEAMDYATWAWATPQGRLVVGFSRPAVPSGTSRAEATWRFGMIARNLPMGDLMTVCNLDARFCNLAAPFPPHGLLLRQMVTEYTALRELAEHTDANAPNFKKDLGAVFQVYGIPGGGALVVMGVPARTLMSAGDRSATDPLATHLRVLVGDSAAGRIVTALDTVRRWPRPASEGAWLTGFVTVPAPIGTWGVSVIAGDTAQLVGSGQRFGGVPIVPFDGKKLDISDPILGREAAGLTWRHDGQEIPLNPTNAWYPDEAAILSFELDGLVSGRSYQTRFEVWKTSGHPGSPSVAVSFTSTASAPRIAIRRELALTNLDPGNYRVVITVIDSQTKEKVSRERLLAVRKR